MLTLIPNVEVVAMAQNGREAIEMTKKHQPDIALMDVNMPEMDGLQAIQTMMQVRPEMACIVISAERDNHFLRRAMAAGARGYIIKPFTSDQLIEVMRRATQAVLANRQHWEETARLRQQRDTYLLELATEYARARRVDEKAMAVFEELAASPNCELRWLISLAMAYVVHQKWSKLKALAERLEKLNQNGA
jgi:YesN/AraC family two-component response regulator